jgi:hypothetical protein
MKKSFITSTIDLLNDSDEAVLLSQKYSAPTKTFVTFGSLPNDITQGEEDLPKPGNPHGRVRLSTIDLLAITSSDQLHLVLKT